MKYSQEAAISEITARGARIRKQRQKSRTKILSGATLALAALLMTALASLGPAPSVESFGDAYGALLLGEKSGGYVLVAVAAFALAAAITILVIRHREKKRDK
ncbi:MAG: glycosyltransferase [Oscillospiraceae bacterium]|nr:glycosyltransferase [Oscillospiraceae bacterium]